MLIILLVLLCLLCVSVLTVTLLFHRYYALMKYDEVDESIPSLTEIEISEILDRLYGEESQNTESELHEESRILLDTSMEEQQNQHKPTVEEEKHLSNVLVIGMDYHDETLSARSDVMIVVSINEQTGKIVLTSLLRDVYLSIPGYPNNRLNASFAFGDVALLQKTIRENFGIEIDRYIAIDFSAFTSIIDLLGGIELELTDKDCQNVFPSKGLSAGTYTLTGEEALRYARWRKGSDDFDRTSRQRNVMTAVINRLLGMSLSKLTDIMEETLPKVRTNLTETDCCSILLKVGALANYEMTAARIPFAGTWEYATIDGRDVLTLDLEENRRLFFENVLGE